MRLSRGEDFSDAVQVITDSARIFIPLDELVDKEKELARLEKERKACEKDIAMVEQKLSSQGFTEKSTAECCRSRAGEAGKTQRADGKNYRKYSCFLK